MQPSKRADDDERRGHEPEHREPDHARVEEKLHQPPPPAPALESRESDVAKSGTGWPPSKKKLQMLG